MKIPRVGIGTLIYNSYNQILLGLRIASHGMGSFGPPGGHLEFGESLEACAIRETKEETGLDIISPIFAGLTNDIFAEANKHYISIFMKANYIAPQEIMNLEPNKVVSWNWYDLNNLPSNLFLPLRKFLSKESY